MFKNKEFSIYIYKKVKVTGIAISRYERECKTHWYPFFGKDSVSYIEFLEEMKPILKDPERMMIFHGIEQYRILYNEGLEINCRLFDTRLGFHYLRSDKDKKLKNLINEIFNYQIREDDYEKKSKDSAFSIMRLKEWVSKNLRKEGLENLFFDIEMKLLPTICKMGRIKVDQLELLKLKE
ncbi:MAG: hypothetical protein ACTSYF_05130 [Promethearchaeota archaeon]